MDNGNIDRLMTATIRNTILQQPITRHQYA